MTSCTFSKIFYKTIFCSFTSIILFCQLSLAQTNLCLIQLLDEKTNEPLIGANIEVESKVFVTDLDGKTQISFNILPVTISCTYIGFESKSISLESVPTDILVVKMSLARTMLEMVTVTGTKFEKNITESTISIDILKPELLRATNAASSSGILNKIPGVQVLDGQANIRGGSGYSYGAGSRVMLLVDDIPALQMDAGFPNWNDIPIENLSQIEVLKGAASTLYGSSALNGIINYRTAYATSEPETRLSMSFTNFASPKDEQKKWWRDSTMRYQANASFVHRRKINKLDLSVGGFYNEQKSFLKDGDEKRGRGFANFRYRITDRLTIGLNLLGNITEGSSFFLWKDGGSGVLQGLQGTISERNSTRYYIDPSLTYFDAYDNKHKVLWRTNLINNENNTNQSNNSINHYGEYQFQKNFKSLDLIVSSGIVGMWNATNSQILGDTTFNGNSSAAYVQMDKKWNKKFTLSGGLRYEYVAQRSPENFMGTVIPNGLKDDGQLIARLGANYSVTPLTFLRASWGQGYRFPTLTERFVTTTFGDFSIFSNPNLEPEKGWSAELGIKQALIGNFKGYIDGAVFVSEYSQMIEFTFVGLPMLGFQPQNVGNIRISGFEISGVGQVTLGKVVLNNLIGYTFINPIYKDFDTNENIRNSVSGDKNILKYRSKHQVKADIEAGWRNFKLGGSLQRVSHMENIDRAFESVPPINFDLFGIGSYRAINNKGYYLLDGRLSYQLKNVLISLLANNILNIEYSLRPALIEAPRNYAIRLDVDF